MAKDDKVILHWVHFSKPVMELRFLLILTFHSTTSHQGRHSEYLVIRMIKYRDKAHWGPIRRGMREMGKSLQVTSETIPGFAISAVT